MLLIHNVCNSMIVKSANTPLWKYTYGL